MGLTPQSRGIGLRRRAVGSVPGVSPARQAGSLLGASVSPDENRDSSDPVTGKHVT